MKNTNNSKSFIETCFLIAILALFTCNLNGQQSTASLLIGVEGAGYTNYLFEDHNKGTKLSYGFNIEKPINKWSIGTGFSWSNYGLKDNFVRLGTFRKDEEIRTEFLHEKIELKYYSVPVYMKYRVSSCNCIYGQIGLKTEFIQSDGIVVDQRQFDVSHPSYFENKEVNYNQTRISLELGVGFSMHITDWLRFYMRPNYSYTTYVKNASHKQHYLSMAFGIQVALLKPQPDLQKLIN